MIPYIDAFLNRVTMYRLMLYYLLFLLIVAVILSFFSTTPYKPLDILLSATILTFLSYVTNKILAWMFNAVTNTESSLITGLILALIVDPTSKPIFLVLIAVLAMSSKYITSIRGRHLFNPVAFAALVSALTVGQGASWWVNNLIMAPFIIIGGLLILRKIRRFQIVAIFLVTYLLLAGIVERMEILERPVSTLTDSLINSPILFFSFVMLVEPLTSPAKRIFQLYYGAVVALSYMIFQTRLVGFAPTLELALLTGNLFSYLLNPQIRMVLKLKEKQKIARDIFNFTFKKEDTSNFMSGQFLEWTLPHQSPDSRGNRRFFTISSSPTEKFIMLTVKIYKNGSTFKRALLNLRPGDTINASSLAGEFTLLNDPQKEYVFIAGGIGITPFRSMIKYLMDKKFSKEVTLLYSNKSKNEIVYKEIFDSAKKAFGLKTVYTLTDAWPNWKGRKGYINEKMIKQEVFNYKGKLFYLSGPQPMVQSFEKILKNMGVSRKNIKVDYFPGYDLPA